MRLSRKFLAVGAVSAAAVTALAAGAAGLAAHGATPTAPRSTAPHTATLTMMKAKTAATATSPVIQQISGNGGVINFSGQASDVALNQLQGLATDPAGDVYVANTYDNQVGEISAPSTWTPENLLGPDTGDLGWSNVQNASSTGDSTVTATTADGQSAVNWTWSEVEPNARIQVAPSLTTGTTYTASITMTGQGQVYLDFYNGDSDYTSQTVTLSSTPQTVSVTITAQTDWTPLQIRTPAGSSQSSINVTAWNASIVSNPATLSGKATLIAGKDEWVTSHSTSGRLLNLGNGGPAVDGTLNTPSAVAVDSAGDVFIADTENNMVREVTRSGIIKTVAGTGRPGYSGDGGPAVDARLDNPSGLAVNAAGGLYIADTGNNALRAVSSSGVISTLAGGNGEGNSGQGGLASKAQLDTPESVAVDSTTGDVYVTSRSGVLDQITGLPATS